MTTDDIINGLKHTADDHPCCAATLNEAAARLQKLDNFVAWMRGRTHELDRYNAHTTLSMYLRKLDELANAGDELHGEKKTL